MPNRLVYLLCILLYILAFALLIYISFLPKLLENWFPTSKLEWSDVASLYTTFITLILAVFGAYILIQWTTIKKELDKANTKLQSFLGEAEKLQKELNSSEEQTRDLLKGTTVLQGKVEELEREVKDKLTIVESKLSSLDRATSVSIDQLQKAIYGEIQRADNSLRKEIGEKTKDLDSKFASLEKSQKEQFADLSYKTIRLRAKIFELQADDARDRGRYNRAFFLIMLGVNEFTFLPQVYDLGCFSYLDRALSYLNRIRNLTLPEGYKKRIGEIITVVENDGKHLDIVKQIKEKWNSLLKS